MNLSLKLISLIFNDMLEYSFKCIDKENLFSCYILARKKRIITS